MNSTNTVKKPPKGRLTTLLDQELLEKMDAERRQGVSKGERVTMSSLANERLKDSYNIL